MVDFDFVFSKSRFSIIAIGMTNFEIARQYLKAIESGATGDELARFFTPDAVYLEMPNRVSAHGSKSDLAQILQGAERGKQLFKRQSYAIANFVEQDDAIALEVAWTGVTAVQIQNLPPGSEMRDHVAIFLEFREGRIARQRNYDCFEPW